jgi:hypothetical protein
VIDGLVADGVNLVQFNKAVLGRLRELMLERVAENKIGEAKTILAIIEQFTCAGEELKSAIIPQLPLELAAILVIGADEKPVELSKKADTALAAPAQKKSPEIVEPVPKTEVPVIPVVPKVETPAAPEPAKPEPVEPEKLTLNAEITLEAAAVALRTVVPKLKLPAAKMALKTAQIIKIEANKITIGVGSELYRDKASQPETKNELSDLLGAELGVPVQFAFEVAEIEIKSAAPETAVTAAPAKSAPAKKDLATAAEDLFSDGADW